MSLILALWQSKPLLAGKKKTKTTCVNDIDVKNCGFPSHFRLTEDGISMYIPFLVGYFLLKFPILAGYTLRL